MRKNFSGLFSRLRAMTLIEILIAASVLVTFLLPVYGLNMMNSRKTEFLRAWNIAVDLAGSVMERILSEDVPFLAIEPQGYSGGTLTISSNRAQADFRTGFASRTYSDYNLKSILGAPAGGDYVKDDDGDRVIIKRKIPFKILFWAGIYQPDSTLVRGTDNYKKNADPTKELTFSYYQNPWFDTNNDCAEDVGGNSLSAKITTVGGASTCSGNKGRPINPYGQQSGSQSGFSYSNTVDDPYSDSYRYGFPVPGASAWGALPSASAIFDAEKNAQDLPSSMDPQDHPYSPRYEDKDFHNFEDLDANGEDDGGLMKVVVGIAFKARGSGEGTSVALQEYYLVSFKSNLMATDD